MSKNLKISVSPHIHSGNSTRAIMLDVIIALLPTAIAGTIIFGARSLLVLSVCIAWCVHFELLYNLIVKKTQTIGDLSAIVTGLLLGLNLPATIPIWQCVIGSFIAIIIVKCLFGGIGCNLVNPAITARVFMLVSFKEMIEFAAPTKLVRSFTAPSFVDTISEATPLSTETTYMSFKELSTALSEGNIDAVTTNVLKPLANLFMGVKGGAIGEVCVLALLIGLVYLLIRRIITWHIPVTFIGTVFLCYFFIDGFNPISALAMILSGGLFIGAIFMATDYVTSPSTSWGKVIFGIGAGLLTFAIRYYGSYPEGVSFAILLMNIVTPYIDKLTKRKVILAGGKKS